MATLRELKGRIGSVASSEKITGAMKMISSAKMHKAEQALKRLLPYRTLIEGIIGNLLDSDAQYSSPLTAEREVERRAVVVWAATTASAAPTMSTSTSSWPPRSRACAPPTRRSS